MKYVVIAEGLGNQMFQYAFCLGIRAKRKRCSLIIPLRKKTFTHNGYELKKLFTITKDETLLSALKSGFVSFFRLATRSFSAQGQERLYSSIGIHIVSDENKNFLFNADIAQDDNKNELFIGTWQSEKYFTNAQNEVREAFRFKEEPLSGQTKALRNEIQVCNSVSIHIRRGDYMTPQYISLFGNICNEQYYQQAIAHIKQNVENPRFYIFTDDKEWVNSNFKLDDAQYVNFNTGKNSWQDMFLMSQCKHNIIANSTFSWWGAWLNSNPSKITIAPKKWSNAFEKDDIIPDSWIRF
ncbi:hypothetical protein M2132_000605 [Dysgonomonas sp. PH5-45]|uniref:alpha-1,2-fucosyltransferase n=1 Tax=unclassified Dysgonomonas TaxID=2630389 RepID=UPI00247413D8|nr:MULTISPECIES: alpha-1,2-fucosyltransferase [unclassified Dysgonomonas]MDH6354278.1 hypothetical protein [Dysgonomonas sp. PH5-45]MDH6387179.1 hypothetical protein [Dysgonomonas sp. PH5-37]